MITKKEFFNLFEWSCVLYVAGIMVIFGLGKYWQFHGFDNDQFAGMKIMWNFYSYSKPYVIILGIFEVVGAILLLIPKTRIVGCLLISSILINVILQDYFYEIPALFSAITLQLLVFFILWLNRIPFLEGLKKISNIQKNINPNHLLKHIFYVLLMSILLFIFLYYLILFVNRFTL
ncbi:hypothetical protein [Kaistella polysaccharea]|uniref:hypothetical protein n=1 Tax=Kaistella polysaccharea TaxID=2878534 RepID=UPI001CF5E42B|nr:hypothetical protein [Kaistella polysaccharea]